MKKSERIEAFCFATVGFYLPLNNFLINALTELTISQISGFRSDIYSETPSPIKKSKGGHVSRFPPDSCGDTPVVYLGTRIGL